MESWFLTLILKPKRQGNLNPSPKTVLNPQHSFLQETLRYLCFDCLVIDDQNVMTRPLDKRYGVCRHIQPICTTSGLTNPPL